MSYIRQLLIRQALRHKTNRPSGLIGQYKPYLNSNDSPTRDTLKDYSGQGHDIQLYNFGYALQSGYGSWAYDFTNKSTSIVAGPDATNDIKDSQTSFNINYVSNSQVNRIIYKLDFKCKVKITGLTYNIENKIVERLVFYGDKDGQSTETSFKTVSDGIYDLNFSFSSSENTKIYVFAIGKQGTPQDPYKLEVPIIIEQIPDYPGALVSDGVDDYGLCENFPILTREKGYTICAIREPIRNDKTCALLAHGIDATSSKSVFIFEAFTPDGDLITSWGNANYTEITDNKFSFLKSDSYNNISISKGNLTQSVDNRIALFSYTANGFSYLQKAALYALEIYDHDLTDEEIQSVKEAMYNEYLTATNALQNHIIADYECYDKTNEDEDRDVLKDLSGNGHDITLYNFGFAEGSGYGLYAANFKTNLGINGLNFGSLTRTDSKVQFLSEKYFATSGSPLFLVVKNTRSWKLKTDNFGAVLKINNNGNYEVYADIEPNSIGEVKALSQDLVDANTPFLIYPKIPINIGDTFTLEQIPEYQGALVSDGVDDFGLCENFPILNKEDGYTVLAIKKILDYDHQKETATPFVMFPPYDKSPFVFECYKNNIGSVYSFGAYDGVNINPETSLSYMTSKSYNGTTIPTGEGGDYTNTLCLFTFSASSGYRCSNIAFYRAMILNKDCTTEEIKFIAKQMVAKHKEKTGETIELNF